MGKYRVKTLIFFGSMVAVLMLISCATQGPNNVETSTGEISQKKEKITIVTSFYPLAEFSNQVGKDKVDVKNITPPGVEPHDYEPTPQDIAAIETADFFIFNGAGQDPWAEKAAETLKGENTKIIDMSANFELLEGGPEDLESAEETHNAIDNGEESTTEHTESTQNDMLNNEDSSHSEIGRPNEHTEAIQEDGHGHELDPHFWLDPTIAVKQVQYLRDIFIEKDPANADFYRNNAEQYMAQLSALHFDFRKDLSSCKIKTFITSHKAFDYLAKQYGLKQLAIAGISPEEEPSARQLANLAQLAKENKINVIFFETLVSPDLAKTLADEIGAESMVLNPIEGLTKEEVAKGENYITLMKKNLNNLKTALQCAQVQ